MNLYIFLCIVSIYLYWVVVYWEISDVYTAMQVSLWSFYLFINIYLVVVRWGIVGLYIINIRGPPEYGIVVVRGGIVGLYIINLGGTPEYDIVVVGGGIVGLAVAQEITNRTSSFKVRIFIPITFFLMQSFDN